ncbi:MAG: NAD(P)/FAD-dependent oxidoreductase [Steroidobacteraceae bacterium]
MTRAFDSVVIGGSVDGLVAATVLASSGSTVLLVEAQAELGGTFREIEFAPGYRAAPLATDLGHVDAEILLATGAMLPGAVTPDPVTIALGDGEPLQLRRSIAATAEGLKSRSAKDAAAWPAFCARMRALSGFLAELYRRAPPQLEAAGLADYLALAKLGLKFRGLGKAGMVDLLRALPMPIGDLLDDWFESGPLKGALAALGVADLCQGPASGGTALNFLHRHVGAEAGVFGDRLRLQTGGGALVAAFADRARAANVTIETGAEVRRLLVADDRVSGVELASGEEIRSGSVISGLDPYRSLLELLDPVHLDPEFIAAIRNIRYRGVTSIVLLALEGLPSIPGLAAAPSGSILIAPSVREVERAFDASKYGRCSEEPVVELRFPSVTQSKLAPMGRHVAMLRVQYTPYRLRDRDWARMRDNVAKRAVALVERHVPGFTDRVRHFAVLTPADLETQFGLREGAVSRGELALDQMLFMRPVAGASSYAMPVPGLFLCGAGTHPGYGMTGLSGLHAARAARPR